MKSNIIIIGLGLSGFTVLDFFANKDVNIVAFDSKTDYDEDKINILRTNSNISINLGQNPTGDENADLVIISPGISMDLDFVRKFISRNIEITGEIELAYRYGKGKFIGITGTNGKTTTTTLVGNIFSEYNKNTKVVGNIGYPALEKAIISDEDTYLITELSSFQLESIKDFKVKIAAILNITEDHLNRHKTMENYIKTKFRIFENQNESDFLVLNYDDLTLRLNQEKILPKIFYFSRKETLYEGVWIENKHIVACINNKKQVIMSLDEINILGNHNLENILASISISLLANININIIKHKIIEFKGVEHRLELVRIINGVNYINDSKATNPDSSIKAIEAVNPPIILIAGGMNKNSDYKNLINSCLNKVKHLILLGETKDEIAELARTKSLMKITKVETMKEAVMQSSIIANAGDTVLFSPACASWDMYENFEKRGQDFKACVNCL